MRVQPYGTHQARIYTNLSNCGGPAYFDQKNKVLGVATKQWRVHQAVLTVQPYRLRHILAFAIKESLRMWKWTAKSTSFGGWTSIKWLDVTHVQKQNLSTNRFGWARYINDCEECGLHADAVKPLLHGYRPALWPQALFAEWAIVG